MSIKNFKILKDSMGEIQVPEDAKWGAQTQRAINNFPISGKPMPKEFIQALGWVKAACAKANLELNLLDQQKADAIYKSAIEIANGKHDTEFLIDIFQTGSGTSSNMNANEVIAHLANVHPNDDVNKSQSSNDVIPTTIAVAGAYQITNQLIPSIDQLVAVINNRLPELNKITKTGRTHLMDAMPVTMGQEFACFIEQLEANKERLSNSLEHLVKLPIGGTAVGTGINAHPEFASLTVKNLTNLTNVKFESAANKFLSISTQDPVVAVSSNLKNLAVSIMKIANDLRWMNSGPIAGLGEIALPSLQPGSSIMPGKVNPVIAESACMVCAQVIGNDTTITIAGQSGNFELNVMLPVIASNLLESIKLLSTTMVNLADNAIKNFSINQDTIDDLLAKNPILVTALNAKIGYELGAKIAKTAYQEKRSLLEVALELTDLSKEELTKILNPAKLTRGGIA